MESPAYRHIFYARVLSCLRALKDMRDKLEDGEKLSRDGVDVDIVNLRVETTRKLGRHLEAIEEVPCRMLFGVNLRLFTEITLKILSFQTQLKFMQSIYCDLLVVTFARA